jgi:branched-chain amino acid transport system substrate-binding protein
MTIANKVKFDESHFNRGPVVFGQWFKMDKPHPLFTEAVLQ